MSKLSELKDAIAVVKETLAEGEKIVDELIADLEPADPTPPAASTDEATAPEDAGTDQAEVPADVETQPPAAESTF